MTIKNVILDHKLSEEVKLIIEQLVNREYLTYQTDKYVYNFQEFETRRYFAKNICEGKVILNNVGEDKVIFCLKLLI